MAQSTIHIGGDVSGLNAAVVDGKKSLAQLTAAAQDTGRKGGAAGKQIGVAVEESAQKVQAAAKKQERATQTIIRSIEREIAARESGGRNTAAFFEKLAEQRGADMRQVGVAVSGLKKLDSQLKTNTISAGQYQAAMRMLPAQMTDVVTQLAGGQNPLLIALQQGGQTRDMFGGFGNMFKGIASLVSPVRLALGGLAGGVAAVGAAAYQGSEEIRAYQKALVLAGGAAGVSAGQLQNVAVAVGQATGGYSQAREAVLAFVESGKIGAADYERFSRSVVLQSQATGQSVDELVQKYIEIANDPAKAVLALSATYKSMTADVYSQVKALQEQGREQEAVALVQNRYAAETDEMSKQVLENLGAIERGWKSIKESAADAWDGLKSIGRQKTVYEQLLWTQEQLAKGETWWNKGFREKLIKDQERLIGLLGDEQQQLAKTAAADLQRRNQLEGLAALDKISESYATREEQRKKKQIELEAAYKKAIDGVTDAKDRQRLTAQYERDKARINESYAEKEKKGRSRKEPEKYLNPYVGNYRISSPMGPRNTGIAGASRNHQGVDVAMPVGTPLRAMAAGTATVKAQNGGKSGYGFYIDIKYDDGSSSRYAHLDKQLVKNGQRVKAGEVVGLSGNSGTSSGPHAHIESRDAQGRLRDYRKVVGMRAADKEETEAAEKLVKIRQEQEAQQLRVNNQFAAYLAQMHEEVALLGKEGAAARLQAQIDAGRHADKSAAQLAEMMAAAKHRDEQERLYKVVKKYGDISENLQARAKKQLDDKLFEISLIGKTREEIEKLTLARLWDQQIAEAQQAGLPAEGLEQMRGAKSESLSDLGKKQQAQKEVDDDWRGGFDRGLQEYIDSFGSMNDAIAGATEQTFDRMGDAIADFVATGKLDFRGLTVSILQDLSKMLIKMAIVNAMKSALGGYANGGVVGADGSGLYGSAGDFGGWSGGGYTGPGGKHEPAGIVHRGEVVFSQDDVRRFGGVNKVEAMRLRGYAAGGVVGAPALYGAAAVGGNTTVNITINRDGSSEADTESDAKAGKALGAFVEGKIAEWAYNNMSRPGQPFYKGA